MFLTTLEQVGILLIFIITGFFFRKMNIINDNGSKVLAKLLTYLFAPCYMVVSLSSVVTIEKISEYFISFLAGGGVALFAVLISLPLVKILGKDAFEKNILKYALAFGNVGYFGYPVVGAIYGAEMRALMIIFCVPTTILINTYGYYVLTKEINETSEEKVKTPLKKKLAFLYSPLTLSVVIGIVLGLLPVELPEFITGLLNTSGNCMSAVAMLLTGSVLANSSVKELFISPKPYIVGAIKLIVLPLITGGILYLIHLMGAGGETFDTIFKLSVIVTALPVGMNVVVFPESIGRDSTVGAKLCFLSYIMVLVTLPIVCELLGVISVL